jgi:hypothetical protein
MAKRIPTQSGDVLILQTDKSFTAFAVGIVSTNGQLDFHSEADVKYLTDRTAAVTLAKSLVTPGRRIVVRNIDTNAWAEISTG